MLNGAAPILGDEIVGVSDTWNIPTTCEELPDCASYRQKLASVSVEATGSSPSRGPEAAGHVHICEIICIGILASLTNGLARSFISSCARTRRPSSSTLQRTLVTSGAAWTHSAMAVEIVRYPGASNPANLHMFECYNSQGQQDHQRVSHGLYLQRHLRETIKRRRSYRLQCSDREKFSNYSHLPPRHKM